MAGNSKKLNCGNGWLRPYDFANDSKIKGHLLTQIKRECFGGQRKAKCLTDDELESAVAAAKPKPDDRKDKKPPTR